MKLPESGRAQEHMGSLQGLAGCPRAGRQTPIFHDTGHSSHREASPSCCRFLNFAKRRLNHGPSPLSWRKGKSHLRLSTSFLQLSM